MGYNFTIVTIGVAVTLLSYHIMSTLNLIVWEKNKQAGRGIATI